MSRPYRCSNEGSILTLGEAFCREMRALFGSFKPMESILLESQRRTLLHLFAGSVIIHRFMLADRTPAPSGAVSRIALSDHVSQRDSPCRKTVGLT
jgi:hypothetical protein